MMLMDSGPENSGWRIYAKTGLALRGGGPAPYGDAVVGWIVGFVDRGGRVAAFAVNAGAPTQEAPTPPSLAPARLQIARELLRALGVPPQRP